MRTISRVVTLLTALCLAPNIPAANRITGIRLSPSYTVVQGTTVTVTVQGTGICTVFVETNGASDKEGGFADYQLGPAHLPLSVSFKANKTGTFMIAATGVDPRTKMGCLPVSTFAVNTTLTVLHPADRRLFGKELNPRPRQKLPNPAPGPIHAPINAPASR